MPETANNWKAKAWSHLQEGDYQEFSESWRASADDFAKKFLADRRSELEEETSGLTDAMELTLTIAAEYMEGGKKHRGGLLIAGYSVSGGEAALLEDVINAAIGYELLHNAFLVHDDIMDNAETRRRKTTAWIRFTKFAIDAGMPKERAEDYGKSQATNLGDLIAFWGPAAIAMGGFPGDHVKEAMILLNKAVQTTVAGQTSDIDPETARSPGALSRDYVISIARNKTARYSFVTPMQIGAVLGKFRIGSPEFTAMEAFGIPVGIVFQLRDDDLGVYGEENEIGKSPLSDLREGKKTLFFVELYEKLNPQDRKRFSQAWGNRDATREDLLWVRDMGETTRARQAVRDRAMEFVAQSKRAIADIAHESQMKRLFEGVAEYAFGREY